LLRYQLQRGGIDPRGVKMVAMTNSSDRVVALGNGQVKGALLIAPFDSVAEKSGLKILDVYKEPYVQTPLIVNTGWASKNRAAAIALVKALNSAAAWINDPKNKDQAVAILSKFTNTDPATCAQSYAFIVEQQHAIGSDLSVSADGLENIIKIDNAIGANPASTKAFDLKRYYDPSFLSGR
jgi:ABC-type nitrate/sulfonate/bicarbonate transport system substrate-binding protein